MVTGLYRIGGQLIRINSLLERVQNYCKDYRVPEESIKEIDNRTNPVYSYMEDLSVTIRPEDLAYERQQYLRMALHEGQEIREWSDAYLEELAVYRKIAEWMPGRDTVLFHGSVVAVDGLGYLFTAPSGTGKSTHVRLWRETLGDRAVMVNDDKPLIRIDEQGRATAFGTPWNGKHHLGGNISAPLQAVCLLERAEENRIQSLPKKDLYPILLQQVYRPKDPAAMGKTLQLIDRLNVRFYRLGCNMDPAAAELSFQTMSRTTDS